MTSLTETPEYQAAARFVDLTLEKKALMRRLDEINDQLKTLEPALVGYLTALGQKRFIVKDCLLSTTREPWIYPMTGVSRQMVCEGLKLSGWGTMVKENYSTQSLTRRIKDLESEHRVMAGLQPGTLAKLLPAPLVPLVNMVPSFKIKVTRQETDSNEEYEQESESGEEA